MAYSTVVKSTASVGTVPGISLPSWGRSFWQDPNDGKVFLAYASGNKEVDYITSADSGVTWGTPKFLFSCDDFSQADNFDTVMDIAGNIHCLFQYANSGCYKFVQKDAGDWTTASGDGRVAFVAAAAVGPSGMQGSLMYSPGPLGSDISASYPLVRIATKTISNTIKCFYVQGGSNKYKIAPKEDSGVDSAFGVPQPGVNGGYPIWAITHASFPTNRAVSLAWSSTSGTIAYATRGWGFWGGWNETKTGLEGVNNGVNQGSGLYPFGPNMAFASGTIGPDPHVGNNWPVVVSTESGIECYCMGSEPMGNGSFFARMDSTYVGTNGARRRSPEGWPLWGVASGIHGAAQGTVNNRGRCIGGTNVDITWTNERGTMLFYFQDIDGNGIQRISRLKGTPEYQNLKGVTTNTSSFTGWRFSELTQPVSGLVSEAMAWTDYCGQDVREIGARHHLFWRGFKALRHPVDQTQGCPKPELVVTVGDSIQPSGTTKLVAWDFDKSVRATGPFALPSYEFMATQPPSGTNPLFTGVARHGLGASDDIDPGPLFDDKLSTALALNTDDWLILEFSKPTVITRTEILITRGNLQPNIGDYHLLAGLEDGDFRKVFAQIDDDTGVKNDQTISKITADRSLPLRDHSKHQNWHMDAFVAKFLKFQFTSIFGHAVRQIRVYSPHATRGEWATGFDAGTGYSAFGRRFDYADPIVKTITEDFRSCREGERPHGWRTSGDWDWFVRASGDMSRTSRLTPLAPQNGLQEGGVFNQAKQGRYDGFVMRTMESGYRVPGWGINGRTVGAPLGTSGILEVDVHVGADEFNENGDLGRTIGFDVRYDMLGSGIMGGPEDDYFKIFHTDYTGAETEVTNYWAQGNCFMSKCDWYNVSFAVPTGLNTIKWVYKRGTVNPTYFSAGERGIVWIDNVRGMDAPTTPTIKGFIIGENSYTTPTGIYGVLHKAVYQHIRGYAWGAMDFWPRHGYVEGGPNAESRMHGYLYGNTEARIQGYAMGGSGLFSYPTGSIGAYVAVQSGDISSICAYVLGNRQSQIHGYVGAYSSGSITGSIDGYLAGGWVTDSGVINGFLNGGAASGTINAYVYGPPGSSERINAYVQGYHGSGNILGYMKSFAGVTGIIHAYLSGVDGTSSINAYMAVCQGRPSGYIQGYLLNTGVSGSINGYMNSKELTQVFAYLQGAEFGSGNINGYIQGFATEEINGYIAGISGIGSGSINSFIVGAQTSDGSINGCLVATQDNICDSHGSVPLVSIPAYTLPTSCFNDEI